MRIPVSVVIPCYRCADTLRLVIKSVLDQTVQPAEILLIDDASGDGTKGLMNEIAAEHPSLIRALSLEKNSGPGIARNEGWNKATQPWIAFLDADDVWHPQKLEIQWSWLQEHPEVILCGHTSALLEESYLPITHSPQSVKLSPAQMLISNRLPTRSVMLCKDLPFRFQGKSVTEDYLLWLQVVLSGYPAYALDTCMAFSLRPEFSPGGYSGQLWKHEKRELNALKVLYKERYLNVLKFSLWSAWSYVKYLRREFRMRAQRA